MSDDNCHVCDRPRGPTTAPLGSTGEVCRRGPWDTPSPGRDDCEAHRVDWRARALEAEGDRAGIVRRLAGEWGEMEVGPTESVDDLVSHIHDTAKVFMLHVTEIQGLEAKLSEARQAAIELRDLCRSEGLETNPVDEPFTLPWEADSR